MGISYIIKHGPFSYLLAEIFAKKQWKNTTAVFSIVIFFLNNWLFIKASFVFFFASFHFDLFRFFSIWHVEWSGTSYIYIILKEAYGKLRCAWYPLIPYYYYFKYFLLFFKILKIIIIIIIFLKKRTMLTVLYARKTNLQICRFA